MCMCSAASHGATTTNEFVNIQDFFSTQVIRSVAMILFGLARTVYFTVYDRILGDFPAKNTVHALYIYDFSQPYSIGMK